MPASRSAPRRQGGVMLLEALIAILIFSIGILAVVGMQATAVRSVTESRSRSEAALLANQLLAQIWMDAANVNQYIYPGAGAVPARLTDWMNQVQRLPGAVALPPVISVAGATAQGGTVSVQIFWRNAEETSQGLPPHNYTVTAAVYGN